MTLDRVALHQTRLRAPGLRLDSKGVALGAKGLVLLPSVDRLVGFLALYTAGASLGDLLSAGLTIDVVKSKLGGREVALSFSAEGSDRMDRIAELARLSGGYTFTGTQRHFVQYRDAAAPFGYDLREISPTSAALSLSHSQFTQDYQFERRIELASLLLKLEPRVAPATALEPGPKWLCAETGLGPALIHYFVRSNVAAEVGVAEWPPASEFDSGPVRRYLFRVPELPPRMLPLLRSTPGIGLFAPAGAGSAVELGFAHPINLRACPVFPPEGLVLLRGNGAAPLRIDKLPALGPVTAFARVRMEDEREAAPGIDVATKAIGMEVRLAPDPSPWSQVTGALVEDLSLLRLLAYRLGRSTLQDTRIAFTAAGAFLVRARGIEAVPLGELFCQLHPQLFVSAGYSVTPAVAPEVLFRSFGEPRDSYLFLHHDGRRIAVEKSAFVPLEEALLEAQAWQGVAAEVVRAELAVPLATVALDSPGFRPMRDVSDAEEG